MTILQVVQSVALRVIGKKPTSAFSPTSDMQTVMEIVDLANDVARDISGSHDWQALTKIATITGNGTQEQFPLPPDYDRMLLASSIVDQSSWFWGYCPIPTVTDWLMEEGNGWQGITPGAWIIIGDEFNFVPAPSSGAEAKYPYITREIVQDNGSGTKESFTTDTDTFRLDERLLVLGTIWRWKEQKGLEYGEDMQNYEIALSQAQARDRGARTIRRNGSVTGSLNLHVGWPWPLGGGT